MQAASRPSSRRIVGECSCLRTAVQSRPFASSSRKGKDAEVAGAGEQKPAQPQQAMPNYPFSDSVSFANSPIQPKSPEQPFSVMDRVNRSLILPSTSSFRNMFARRHPDRIPPGSIISVESYTGSTPGNSNSTTGFAGVLMAVKRRHMGVDNAFTVRANVGKPGVGTEVRFDVNSPWIKNIRVLRRNDDTRRAKLYYIRRSDKYLAGVQGAIRNSIQATADLTNEARSTKKTSPASKSSTKKNLKKEAKK